MRTPTRSLRLQYPDGEVGRSRVAVSLGPHVQGAAMYHPDHNDPVTVACGFVHRVGCVVPQIDPRAMRRFRAYVWRVVESRYEPIPADADLSVETWLANSRYTAREREAILKVWYRDCGDVENAVSWRTKSFVKDEFYTEPKYPRLINARGALMKAFFGPTIKAIEGVVFSHCEFAKHIPWNKFPETLRDHITEGSEDGFVALIAGLVEGDDAVFCHNGRYYFTDYTSFESSFEVDMLRAVEAPLFHHMTSQLPNHREFMRVARKCLWGSNVMKAHKLRVKVRGKRMSGDMHTSLGNGHANVCAISFLCSEARGRDLTEADFAQLGLRCKMVVASNVGDGSFCGQVFEEVEMMRVRNPIDVLVRLPWSKRNQIDFGTSLKLGLLKCKAICLRYEMPNCPILWRYSAYLLRVLRGVGVVRAYQQLTMYERDFLKEAMENATLDVGPGVRTRGLVERLYGISVGDQLVIESWLDSLTTLQPLDNETLMRYIPDSYRDAWDAYHSDSAGVQFSWVAARANPLHATGRCEPVAGTTLVNFRSG